MTPKEREAFYDREIAPVLLELAGKCQANEMSLFAVVEWAPGEQGRTISLRKHHGLGIRFANLAAAMNGNVDGLFIEIEKYAREHGHNSAYLSRLGVPAKSNA